MPKNHRKKDQQPNIFGKIIIILAFACWTFYVLIRPSINDLRLERNGVCIRATLIAETTRVRYHKAELKYQFNVAAGQYQGLSSEADPGKIGDTICIIYLPANPSINKPTSELPKAKASHCN